jgi:hypothetical protein
MTTTVPIIFNDAEEQQDGSQVVIIPISVISVLSCLALLGIVSGLCYRRRNRDRLDFDTVRYHRNAAVVSNTE